MKKYLIVNNNGEVQSIEDNKKATKKELNRIIREENKRFWEWSYKDYEVRTMKFDARKFYLDLRFFGELIVVNKETQEAIEYDDYNKNGVFDKLIKKDFLYK